MSSIRHISVLLITSVLTLSAQEPVKTASVRQRGPQKTTALDKRYALLNINNVTAWSRYDGHSAHSPNADDGVYFPRGTGSVIYQDCFLWGGKPYVDPEFSRPAPRQRVRVGGGTYGIGTRAGAVIDPSVGYVVGAGVEDPNTPGVRIYRIRRDYATMSVAEARTDAAGVYEVREVDVTPAMISELRAQYHGDWIAWPVQKGAPFIDRNHNGIFDPPPPFDTDATDGTLFTIDSLVANGMDEPGVAGEEPFVPADQVLWTVYNDLNVSSSLAFEYSEPSGFEIQRTYWAYRGPGSIANSYFLRHVIINKGGIDTSVIAGDQYGAFWIDSLFFAQWSDPDVGDAGNDLIGCDTTLDLAYAYNATATDGEYSALGLSPPAVGYSLLVGPTIPSALDSSLRGLRWKKGQRGLPMTSVSFFRISFADECFSYDCSTGRTWNALRGFSPFPSLTAPPQYVPVPPGMSPTVFPMSGDPLLRTGFIDGLGTSYSPFATDRRLMLNSGPCRIAPGDTQEVVTAFVAGAGADNLTSIAVMKFHAKFVRAMAANGFRPNLGPSRPTVSAKPFDRSVLLRWDEFPGSVAATEQQIISGQYRFEGYNVYELPAADASLHDGVRIATFDLENGVMKIIDSAIDTISGVVNGVLAQSGTESGVRRSLYVTRTKLTDRTNGTPLLNGTEYYFAVTAYNISGDPGAVPRTAESAPVIVTVRPQRPFGKELRSRYGDTLAVRHVNGPSDVAVLPVVVDPTLGTGDTYRLTFAGDPAASWSLSNATRAQIIVAGVPLQYNETVTLPEGGVTVRFDSTSSSRLLSGGDTLEFSVASPGTGFEEVSASLDRIGIYPNPYMGERLQATRSRPQFVTFTNLPARAVIQVFNLAGHLVRTLRKEGPSQFLDWDLLNEYGIYVGSGMYICRVELPDLNAVRVLKLGVVMSMEEPW